MEIYGVWPEALWWCTPSRPDEQPADAQRTADAGERFLIIMAVFMNQGLINRKMQLENDLSEELTEQKRRKRESES